RLPRQPRRRPPGARGRSAPIEPPGRGLPGDRRARHQPAAGASPRPRRHGPRRPDPGEGLKGGLRAQARSRSTNAGAGWDAAPMATATFDPKQYKDTTRTQWETAADAWHRWGPSLREWLGPATSRMLDLAEVRSGCRVLDVAA